MTTDARVSPPRATVIIPTYGHAPFVRCAIESVQAQTVQELEICVILDGSPAPMKELVDGLAARDPRIRVFHFPKASRTGEIHRADVIPQTRGRTICYLGHDDLWFPHHVATMEQGLCRADFTHSIHANLGVGEASGNVYAVTLCDLAQPEVKRRMLGPGFPAHAFGLSFAAHTREAYDLLPEGWATTPEGIPTDLYMWRKFLREPGIRVHSVMAVSALHVPAPHWKPVLSPELLAEELDSFLPRLADPGFHHGVVEDVFRDLLRTMAERECRLASAAEVERRARSLPTGKLWKLVWKRLTRQPGPMD